MTQYTADHHMLVHRSGDPARGHWLPRSLQKKTKRKT